MSRARSPQKIRLESWYLKQVPFPSIPFVDPFNVDPLRNGAVFDPNLRIEEIKKIRDETLKRGFGREVQPWNWLWARKNMGKNLGMGKTAFLTYIVNQINRDCGRTFFGRTTHWLSIYAHILPGTNSIAKMAALVLAGLCNNAQGTSVEQILLSKVRQKVILLKKAGPYSEIIESARENHFLDDQWLEKNGVDLTLVAAAVEKLLLERYVSQDVAIAMAKGTLRSYFEKLNGKSNLQVPSTTFCSKALSILLDDVAHIAEVAEINHVTIFLDDFYYLVLRTPVTQRTDLAGGLRKVAADGPYYSATSNLFNWVAVMHTQTASRFSSAWEERNMHYIAPIKFNLATSLALEVIPYDQGRALLQAYLDYKRPRGFPDKCYPFTPESLEAIARIAGEKTHSETGKCDPRSLLNIAHTIFSEALARDAPPERIDVNFVEHVLNGKPLPAELDDKDNDEDAVPPSEEQMPLGRPCPCTCHEGVEAHDTVVRLAGGTTQQDTRKILGYRCIACNLPVSLRVDSAPLNANNP